MHIIEQLKWDLIDSKKEINDEDPKFEIGDIITTREYTNIFAKGYVQNWTEQVFVIKNFTPSKITLPWTYVISDLKGKKIFRMFYEKELQNRNQKEFRVEKVIKRMGGKLYVKWKGYNNSFNS